MKHLISALLYLLALIPTATSFAADVQDIGTRKQGVDWPKFLGPTTDSKSPEKGIVTTWPETGPRLVWHLKLGEGYCMPVVSRGRLFAFDRAGTNDRLRC